MILVSIILFLFLGNVRGAIIVALTIPFALLFASICLDLSHIPANLLSLGALDFGMVVDGSVVMIENIVRHLAHTDDTRTPIAEDSRRRPRGAAPGLLRPRHHHHLLPAHLHPAGRRRPALQAHGLDRHLRPDRRAGLRHPRRSGHGQHAVPQGRQGVAEPHHGVAHRPLSPRRARRHRASQLDRSASPPSSSLIAIYLTVGGPIGSEFLPHLDEGSIWVRGTLPPSEGPTASIDFTNKARLVMASFPEVTQVVSQTGRPDDGTDTAGFFNTEYFVDLKRKEEWRPVFHQDKEKLIAAIDKELSKFPGVIWNYSQPISDNMEEAVSGVKGELAVKLYGDDLRTLEHTAEQIQAQMADRARRRAISASSASSASPTSTSRVDRDAAARWGINVADIQDAIQTAVGANAVTQVQQGEARYDVTLRYQKQYRDTREAIENIRLLAPSGERVSLAQLTTVSTDDGAEQINREGGQRYIAIKYSVRGRDLGSTVEEAIAQGRAQRQACPPAITSSGPANTKARSAPTSAWPSSCPSPCWPSSSSSTPCSARSSGPC